MSSFHIADVGHVRRLHGSQHHYHLSHRDSMHYSYCGMLHRSALLHTVFQSVGLMNQIRYVVNVGLDIFHPIPFHHSNMLRSDCHRRIRRPHGHMLYRTIHQGVGLINHICYVIIDGEENFSLKMNLAHLSNAANQETPLRCALQPSRYSKRQSIVDDQTRCISI